MHRPSAVFAALLLLSVPLARAAAQDISRPPTGASVGGATRPLLGPRLAPQWWSFQTAAFSGRDHSAAPAARAHTSDLLAQRRARGRAPGTVFMIVGGAVAVVGMATDEGLLIVGGAAVAGYGLYLYLR